MKIRLSLDNQSYLFKPKDDEAANISKRIGKRAVELTKDNIFDIGLEGHAFCPATFNDGKRSRDDFEQLQLLALDFDNKNPDSITTFDKVKQKAELYDLPILFAYSTLSSKNNNKFRAVFLNDNPITDIKAAEIMLKALTTIFPEADPQSSSPVQMYYGGNSEILYYDENYPTINAETILRNLTNYCERTYGANHYKRHIEKFSRDTGISLNSKKLLDVSVTDDTAELSGAAVVGKNLTKSTISIPIGRKLPKRYLEINLGECTSELSAERKLNYHRSYRQSDLPKIAAGCQLYQRFESGEQRLSHQELFGLATNLNQVDTGTSKFIELLRKHKYYDNRPEKYRKWEQDLRYIRDYKPYSCEGYCPYSDKCQHGTNILSTIKPKPYQMERIANYVENLVSIEEAEKDFREKFGAAVKSDAKGWHIIKAQTAIGKTEAILEFLKDTQLKVLVAVPTNRLKREIEQRAEKMGIKLIASPSLHEIKDCIDDIWQDVEELYNSGMSVIPYIKKLITEDYSNAGILKQYLSELEEFKSSNGCAVTTHKRLLSMRNIDKYDIVIVDEDIIFNSIIPNRADISISDLRKLRKKLPPASRLAGKIRKIMKLIKTDEFFELRKIPYDKEAYADISIAVDIPALCSAKHFCFRKVIDRDSDVKEDCVTFQIPVDFNKNVKYIMVSATVDKRICEYYFGDNIKYYDCAIARNTGIINQYYSRSMSRSDISKNIDIFKSIKELSGFENTISFMMFMQHYNGDLHFGNCAGCDYLKGLNIDVIGTPHQPEWIYKLFALSLGLGANVNLRPGSIVVHNGYRFRFTTYDNEHLRTIQYYMIESQLEQAVGRARLLRCDCTVNLFSNFPLQQAVMVENPNYDNRAGDNGAVTARE